MIKSADRQAFLIITPEISNHVLKLYDDLSAATSELGEVYLLFHSPDGQRPATNRPLNIEVFTNDILKGSLGYTPINGRLVPGSNHFPVLQFFLKHPEYKYYWCIEDDVVFNGHWGDFFAAVSPEKKYAFITSHLRRYSDLPNWWWWDSLKPAGQLIERTELISSFNPIYRISREALAFIDQRLKQGNVGHHEVLLPTLLYKAGFSLADFSNKENHLTPILSLCTLRTMRWKPVFIIRGTRKNTLYHPVKSKLTFNQFYDYLNRSIRNKKEYLT